MKKNLKQLAIAVVVFTSRLGILPPNMSVVGSHGFFGGNLLWFMATVFIFDLLRGGFYPGFLFTYFGFLSYFALGKLSQGRFKRQILLLPLASLLFFLISNLGVWLYWYPRTWQGLMMCYWLAVPFYKNTLLGDMVFGGVILVLKNKGYLHLPQVKIQKLYESI